MATSIKGFKPSCATMHVERKGKRISGTCLRQQLVYDRTEEYLYERERVLFDSSTRERHVIPAVMAKRPVFRLITHKEA